MAILAFKMINKKLFFLIVVMHSRIVSKLLLSKTAIIGICYNGTDQAVWKYDSDCLNEVWIQTFCMTSSDMNILNQ